MNIEIDGQIYTARLDPLDGVHLLDEWGYPADHAVYLDIDEWAIAQELREPAEAMPVLRPIAELPVSLTAPEFKDAAGVKP